MGQCRRQWFFISQSDIPEISMQFRGCIQLSWSVSKGLQKNLVFHAMLDELINYFSKVKLQVFTFGFFLGFSHHWEFTTRLDVWLSRNLHHFWRSARTRSRKLSDAQAAVKRDLEQLRIFPTCSRKCCVISYNTLKTGCKALFLSRGNLFSNQKLPFTGMS